MATDKNARVDQESWTHTRTLCHPQAHWDIHHSMSVGIFSAVCSECGKKHFQFML